MKADANRKHTKLDNIAIILFLTLSISQLVSLFSSKKQFSLTQEVNLKIKEINYFEKTSFRAIHTENGANMFISWGCIINWCDRIFYTSEKFSQLALP